MAKSIEEVPIGTRRWALVVALPLLLSACGGGDGDEGSGRTVTPSPSATTATTTGSATGGETSAGAITIDVADAGALGEVLVDGEGTTLYMFDPDKQGESTCYEQCAAAWPPLVEQVSAGEGADDSKLGSVARTNGSQQVTYNGWPLYYFAKDRAAGDTRGQGVNSVWWVLDRDGEPVKGGAATY